MSNQIKVFIEDSIMQKDEPITAGSKILTGFKSPFNATVIERLNEAGIKINRRVTMDEFGIDDYFSDDDIPTAVREAAADEDVCILCNDIFGKIRRQAALNGTCFIKPTYGTVSRYGLIPVATSMDQIGIVCANPRKGFEVLAKINGKDAKDGAMIDTKSDSLNIPSPCQQCQKSMCDVRIAVPDNVWVDEKNICESEASFKNDTSVISKLENTFETSRINLEYFEVYHQVLYILSAAEISNNLNRYDGVKFGYRAENSNNLNDLYFNTRSDGFTLNTKLAIIMGANVLSQENYTGYYEKAMKIRRLIKESLKFDSYDVIALPVQMKGKSKYEQSALYAITALAGLPSVTMPFGDCGVQFIADVGREDMLMKIVMRGNQ
ncbi:MAG: amidase family protein [Lachnospiraceae bacterium]|nr:amidase family protein [Lachnospiraceae bacterium]